jgi:hypothetical protein
MSCCGSQRAAQRQEPSASAQETRHWASAPVEFEYTGRTQLTVTGPLTGAVYHFKATGARLRVHGSDAPSLLYVPGLKPVR